MTCCCEDEPNPYAGLSEEQLRRRLARAEASAARAGSWLALVLLAAYVYVFRAELIAGLTRLGELGRG